MSLKFRIWSKKYKLFTSDPRWPNNQYLHEQFLISPDGEVWLLVGDGDNYFRSLDSSDSEYIVQRATGLKDKNGKEIHEGDILKYKFNNLTAIKVQVQQGDCAWILYDVEYKCHIGHLSCAVKSYEIIGNILENPELA